MDLRIGPGDFVEVTPGHAYAFIIMCMLFSRAVILRHFETCYRGILCSFDASNMKLSTRAQGMKGTTHASFGRSVGAKIGLS